MPKASKTVTIHAPIETMFSLIIDYKSYPKFLTTVYSTKILEENNHGTIVEFKTNVVKKISYTLQLKSKGKTSLTWNLVEGEMMKKSDGAWKLKKIDADTTEATYSLDIELNQYIPTFLTQMMIQTSLPLTLKEFAEEAEKRARNKSAPKRRT